MRQPSTVALTLCIGLVLVVLLSGCSGLLATDTQDKTAFAPGVTTDRVTNATALATANRATLDATSYTYTRNYSQRVENDHYHYAVDHDTRVWVAPDDSYLYHHRAVVTRDDQTSTYVDGVWVNESVAVLRSVDHSNGTVSYTRYRPPDPYPVANLTHTGIAGSLDDARVVETWNESGAEYARVRANESVTRRWQASNDTTVTVTTNHTATATVREDGFVPVITTRVSGDRPLPASAGPGDQSTDRAVAHINDTAHIRITDLGTTRVPRPAWVDSALRATDGMPLGESTPPRAITTRT